MHSLSFPGNGGGQGPAHAFELLGILFGILRYCITTVATDLQVVHFGSCLQSPGKSPFIVVCSDTIMIQVPGLISANS